MHALHEEEGDELVQLQQACEDYQHAKALRDTALIAAYQADHEVEKIMEASGLSHGHIYDLLRQHNVPRIRKTGKKPGEKSA